MLRVTLDSTKTWKQIVDAFATLLTEVHFIFNETGLSLRQLDSSKAAMVVLDLPSGVFQEYSCEGDYDVCLGVDELVKVSKRMASDDKLEFTLNEKDSRFEIKMLGQAERRFSLQILDPPERSSKKTSMTFDAKAELFADSFKQAVKDIGVVSNHVKLIAESDSLTFAGKGDTGDAYVSLKKGDDESPLFELKVEKKVVSMYALNYLSEIAKAMSSDSVTLQFSTNKPIMLEFGIAEGGSITFIIAPRVDRV
ncbi:MAG: proliferating cell nuclear antigen (pcna) [Candidatus Thorarchaeota archaeon]